MKKRIIKLIVCVMLISALMIGFCSAYAHASTPVWLLRAKAGVAAALLAMDLVTTPINVVLDSPIAQSIDPLGRNEWVETLPEYLDRSTIKVVEDTVVIDGVYYSDVWLGPDAAQALRLQGLDFSTAYNIANNQSEAITYAQGTGYAGSTPIYYHDGVYSSTSVEVPLQYGTYSLFEDISVRIFDNGYDNIGKQLVRPGYTFPVSGYQRSFQYPQLFRMQLTSPTDVQAYLRYKEKNASGFSGPLTDTYVTYTRNPFSFDYTSGVIDAPVDPDDGLLVRVPSSYTDPQSGTVVYDIHDFTINYPDIGQPGGHEINIDPSLNPDFETDIELGNGIGDLLLTIFGLDLLNKIINFSPEPVTPEPGPQPGVIDPLPDPDPAPDDPTPGTTIADTDWTKLDEILRWIQSTIDSIRHLTESLQTMLDSIFDAIQSAIQHIAEIPEAIRELADKILEDIELGPAKLFDKALDILKTLFLPLLLPIRAMMNLWHYVVEWIQSITTPFTWIFGIMSGTSGNMVLPIYALLAGGICISIYKALGR